MIKKYINLSWNLLFPKKYKKLNVLNNKRIINYIGDNKDIKKLFNLQNKMNFDLNRFGDVKLSVEK